MLCPRPLRSAGRWRKSKTCQTAKAGYTNKLRQMRDMGSDFIVMTSVSSAPAIAVAPAPPPVSPTPVVTPSALPDSVAPDSVVPDSAAQGDWVAAHYDPALFDQAYNKVRGMGHIQYDFPSIKPPDPPPEWLAKLIEFLGGASSGIRYFIYALAALLLLYILYRIFPAFRIWVDQRFARTSPDTEADAWQPEINRARALLEEAEALAAEGYYAEAVHLLLWRSIGIIGTRLPKLLKPSLTARDIARAPELPDDARAAFATIADVVELSLFGRRPVDREGWERCRDAYSRFAQRENWTKPKGGRAGDSALATAELVA